MFNDFYEMCPGNKDLAIQNDVYHRPIYHITSWDYVMKSSPMQLIYENVSFNDC